MKFFLQTHTKNLNQHIKIMEHHQTKHELVSSDCEEKLELKKFDLNKYSLEDPQKSIIHKFEGRDFNKDSKKNFKTIEFKNEYDMKTFISSAENLKIKSNPKLFSLKSNKNFTNKQNVAKQRENKEIEKNNDFHDSVHNPNVENSVSYANNTFTEETLNNNGKKKYRCVHCGYSTIKREGLIEHLLTHSSERPFECAHCSYRTVRKTTLRKHIVALHLSNSYKTSLDNATGTKTCKPFQCVPCDTSYTYRYSLTRHIRQHHTESQNNDKNKPPSCKICKFSSLNPFVMKNHALTHSMKNFKCETCQITFSRRDVLKRHILLYHTAEIHFQCKPCDRKFSTESGLLKHLQSLTCPRAGKAKTSARQFKCTVCAKAFVYKSVLDLHMVTHTKQYSFKCSHCAQGFATYTLLRYHIYSHSKESLFKCSVCNFTTDHQNTMKTHEADHHKRSTYRCSDCSYKTSKCNMFMKHQAEHKGKGKLQCAHCNYSTDNRSSILQHSKLHIVEGVSGDGVRSFCSVLGKR